jgi:hypothetical protein
LQARNDAIGTAEDIAASIRVLDNDSHSTNSVVSLRRVTPAGHGTATINESTITYEPFADFTGVDTFQYEIADEAGNTSIAAVTVTVSAVNDTPTFTIGAAQTVAEDSGLGIPSDCGGIVKAEMPCQRNVVSLIRTSRMVRSISC